VGGGVGGGGGGGGGVGDIEFWVIIITKNSFKIILR